jgi:uncharacterized protein YdaU (DUF1376 family)
MHFFTVFPDDWLTGTADLLAEETGAFWNLCCHYMAKDGCVPDDDAVLARVVKLGLYRWRNKVKPRLVAGGFIEIRDGFIWQAKCQERLEKDGNFAKKQREKIEKRWRLHRAKSLANNEPADTPVDTAASTAVDTSPSPSPKRKKKSTTDVAADAASSEGSTAKPSPWTFGLSILTTAGCTERQARSLVGKWRKELHGDDSKLLSLFLAAQAKSVVDPAAYIAAAVSKGNSAGAAAPRELSAAEKRGYLEKWGMTRAAGPEIAARIAAAGLQDVWHRVS